MEMRHEVVRHGRQDVLVVSFAGTIAPGSEGNADAAVGGDYVGTTLTREHAALVVDLTDLDYVFGNYIGSWFLPAAKRIPVRLVAAGRTAKLLMGLLEDSGLGSIIGDPPLHASVAAALDSFSSSPPG